MTLWKSAAVLFCLVRNNIDLRLLGPLPPKIGGPSFVSDAMRANQLALWNCGTERLLSSMLFGAARRHSRHHHLFALCEHGDFGELDEGPMPHSKEQ